MVVDSFSEFDVARLMLLPIWFSHSRYRLTLNIDVGPQGDPLGLWLRGKYTGHLSCWRE